MIADGRVVSARTALELNLIDAIGGEVEALAWLKKEHEIDSSLEIRDKKVEENKPTLETWLKDYGSRILSHISLPGFDGLVSIWQPVTVR